MLYTFSVLLCNFSCSLGSKRIFEPSSRKLAYGSVTLVGHGNRAPNVAIYPSRMGLRLAIRLFNNMSVCQECSELGLGVRATTARLHSAFVIDFS